MAFPGTYNFNYYKGDTMEFQVYPKRPDGTAFDLEDFDVEFFIANQRGENPSTYVQCYSLISADNTFITCAIRPEDSEFLTAGTPYVYDIEIRSTATDPYRKVFTLLTGNITITDQVTDINENEES